MFKRFRKIKEKGQTFVEYGVVIAVVACIAIAGFASAGSSINDKTKAVADMPTAHEPSATPIPSATPEPTTAYWGVSTDHVLTISTKEVAASEKSKDGGTVDLTVGTSATDVCFTAWGEYHSYITSINIKDHMAPSNTSFWFDGMSNLTAINNIQNLDTSKDTNMRRMFYNCKAFTLLDVSNFNTSNVTDMAGMFHNCSSLSTLDLSNFNTSNVTDMGYMFCNCKALTSLDVSHFDTSKVTNLYYMFGGCESLPSLNVSNFDTSKDTNMANMFLRCGSLTSLDLSHFNTSNVTDMTAMFFNCTSLTSLDVSHFDTSNVTHMSSMFYGCSSLTSLDTSNFVINAGTANTADMYTGCPAHK